VAVLLVILEITRIDRTVLIEILTLPVFFILKPVANVELPLHVVVFALPLLHALEEVALVSLGIQVFHLPPTVRLLFEHLTLVFRAIGHPHLDEMISFPPRRFALPHFLMNKHFYII